MCPLEMSIVWSYKDKIEIYHFYNHRICKNTREMSIQELNSFYFCQKKIHGIQLPNFESISQSKRRLVYDVKTKNFNSNIIYKIYSDISCHTLRSIINDLFKYFKRYSDVHIYFKGGNFEKKYFEEYVNKQNIIDLGNFNIEIEIENISTDFFL